MVVCREGSFLHYDLQGFKLLGSMTNSGLNMKSIWHLTTSLKFHLYCVTETSHPLFCH